MVIDSVLYIKSDVTIWSDFLLRTGPEFCIFKQFVEFIEKWIIRPVRWHTLGTVWISFVWTAWVCSFSPLSQSLSKRVWGSAFLDVDILVPLLLFNSVSISLNHFSRVLSTCDASRCAKLCRKMQSSSCQWSFGFWPTHHCFQHSIQTSFAALLWICLPCLKKGNSFRYWGLDFSASGRAHRLRCRFLCWSWFPKDKRHVHCHETWTIKTVITENSWWLMMVENSWWSMMIENSWCGSKFKQFCIVYCVTADWEQIKQ